MRLFFVLICCLAIPLTVRADQNDNKKKKKKQDQSQQQKQQQGGAQGQHGNANYKYKGNKGHKNVGDSSNANNAYKWNKANKGTKAEKLAINNPNKGKWNKAKWQTKHYNISKRPNVKIKNVTYVNNYHIKGSENWKGDRYVVFRNYKSEWHDRDWWHSHYNRVVLISGGWYFWSAGYWAPAWGYDSNAYYAYDGPIYGYRGLTPDQVVANVQAALQDQRYYDGEVDGLLGPHTQEALVSYQNSQGLAPTGSIDEPTLNSLGMS